MLCPKCDARSIVVSELYNVLRLRTVRLRRCANRSCQHQWRTIEVPTDEEGDDAGQP